MTIATAEILTLHRGANIPFTGISAVILSMYIFKPGKRKIPETVLNFLFGRLLVNFNTRFKYFSF